MFLKHIWIPGKWMLKREFIEDSIKAGRWLEEKLYEWSEQDEVDGVSASHIAAPGRWRRILQEERGPFDGWKALVAVADAKRRAAYKRQGTVHCVLYFNNYSVRESVHVYWFPPFYKKHSQIFGNMRIYRILMSSEVSA